MRTVLLIDDHEDFRDIVSTMLLAEGFDVLEATCPDQAFTVLRNERPELIICDLFMPFTDGDEMGEFQYSYEVGVRTIEELRWALPDTPVIVTSAAVPTDMVERTKHIDGVTLLPKPFASAALFTALGTALLRAEPIVLN